MKCLIAVHTVMHFTYCKLVSSALSYIFTLLKVSVKDIITSKKTHFFQLSTLSYLADLSLNRSFISCTNFEVCYEIG